MRNQATRNDVLRQQELARQRRRERPVVILVALAAAFTFAHALVGLLTPDAPASPVSISKQQEQRA